MVLKPFTKEFSIQIYAYDGDNDRSDNPVTVKFSPTVRPRIGEYVVKQKDKNGDFEAVRIGNRLERKHKLVFYDASGTTAASFRFASNFYDTLTTGDTSNLEANITPGSEPTLCDGNDEKQKLGASSTLGDACYTYTRSDKVEVEHDEFTAGPTPSIEFLLPSSRNRLNGGRATISIKYHVWAYTGKHVHGDLENPIAETALKKIHTSPTETLTLNIHKCVVTKDCPIK